MDMPLSDTTVVALIGLLGGVVLGLAARLGRFCTLGAIEDRVLGENNLRLMMWGMAIGVAVLGTQALIYTGYITTTQALYFNVHWAPLGSILGGAIFGYGMALAGNCGYGALARLGGGDMRSFVIVLVMGIMAYITLSGPLAYARVALFGPDAPLVIDAFSNGVIAPVIGMGIGLVMIVILLFNHTLRQSPKTIVWGAVVGLAIVSGWAGTQWIANTGFDGVPVVSHTFSAPVGEGVLYLMTASGSTLSFGIGSVAGVLIGAFIGSLIKGHFRWEACEDPRELQRQIGGAALMGFGAVIALGCSVGQGLSAMSLLHPSAPITLLAIYFGAAFGLRQLVAGWQNI